MRQPPFGRLCKGKRKECNHFWTAWLSNVGRTVCQLTRIHWVCCVGCARWPFFVGSPFSDGLFVPLLVIVSSLVSVSMFLSVPSRWVTCGVDSMEGENSWEQLNQQQEPRMERLISASSAPKETRSPVKIASLMVSLHGDSVFGLTESSLRPFWKFTVFPLNLPKVIYLLLRLQPRNDTPV